MKIALVLLCSVAWAQGPEFTKDGKLMRPADYSEWIFVSSGLGMTYGSEGPAGQRFDNVFVNRAAYKEFLKSGAWPDKTMFVLEVREAASKGSINLAGHYQSEDFRLSAEVKDSRRFKDKWEYFAFPASGEPAQPLPRTAGCFACHSQHGAVENTFVQFYPTLLKVAREKGTLKER
ncbi:MAG TPA: cytochrome P460 family protein [Bryobacteraceae bacterium]|jgi:hypothetical protein|nr:cytochrome P460 family protein [Bryobacteraceae bacterium]